MLVCSGDGGSCNVVNRVVYSFSFMGFDVSGGFRLLVVGVVWWCW